MRTKKTITKQTEVEDKVYCNRCGVEQEPKMNGNNFESFYVSARDSEDAMFLDYSFDMCETCIFWLMGHFVIPAERH